MHLIALLEKQFPILYGLLKDHIAEDVDYKVIVFCITAMVTKLVADLLSELTLNVREIHSRKPQSYRTKVSKEFKESKGLILVSSDVSARGVDYPDVTLVVQVGVPADREQYLHRLGRTGRKGKEGQGILLLVPWEEFFLSSVKDLPMTKAPVPLVDPDTRKKGVLPDGLLVAVKQLSSKSKQRNREFINEIGMITALQHPNLVKLYGCCTEGSQLLLIYEFMENNSLARALFAGPVSSQLKLDWPTRRNICQGIARGLVYLHEESRIKIVHRDIKATNILLDKDLNAKISDFGIAKFDEEENTHISTRIAGTITEELVIIAIVKYGGYWSHSLSKEECT